MLYVIMNKPAGQIAYPLMRFQKPREGGNAMKAKVKTALSFLAKAAAILAVVAEAGKKVMSITED
jgi:hypothetical protein